MTVDEAPALSGDQSFQQHSFNSAQIDDELNATLQQESLSASLLNESSANSSSNGSSNETDVTSSSGHDDDEHVSVDPIEAVVEDAVADQPVETPARETEPDKREQLADDGGWKQDVLYLISMDGESLIFDALYAA